MSVWFVFTTHQYVVGADLIYFCQFNDVVNIGIPLSAFPLGNGLAGNPQKLGKLLLRVSCLFAQVMKAFVKIHVIVGFLSFLYQIVLIIRLFCQNYSCNLVRTFHRRNPFFKCLQ